MTLRISLPNLEQPMEASKWLKVQLLAETAELKALFDAIGPFEIFLAGAIVPSGQGLVPQDEFLKIYANYIDALKKGQLPDESAYKSYFSGVLTRTRDPLYALPVGEGKQLIRIARPVIQMQAHAMDYSVHDDKFRPMVFGLDSITWGLQFSYPQLYMDGRTKEAFAVVESDEFPNTHLFHQLQRWMRQNTIPTPFLVGDKRVNSPIRLGKQCLPWINRHPQLAPKQLKVLAHGH